MAAPSRTSKRSSGIKSIVVGVDGSEHGAAALTWVARMAGGTGSKIVAVHAIDIPALYSAPYGVPVRDDKEWQGAIRDEFEGTWCEPLKAAGLPYRTVMEVGRAASVITEVADREDADMIVVGRSGRSGVAELVLGSVSHEVVLRSKRPVLIVSR